MVGLACWGAKPPKATSSASPSGQPQQPEGPQDCENAQLPGASEKKPTLKP